MSRGAPLQKKTFWPLTPLYHKVDHMQSAPKTKRLTFQARNMSKEVPDCNILIVGFNTFSGGMPPDPPSFQGFFLFVTGTPEQGVSVVNRSSY